jgi:DNA-binding transcriptional MocR family regulator
VNAFELYQAAMAQNISIAPGQIFSVDARFTNFIRISFGLTFDDVVEKSFRVLGKLVGNLAQ